MSHQLVFSKCLHAMTAIVSLAVVSTGAVFADAGEQHDDGKAMHPALSAQDKSVVKVLEGYAAAVQSGKIEEVEKFVVTDDGFTSLEGASLDKGWQSYRKHMASEMPMFKDTRYEFNNIQPFVSGDLAYATMGYVMNITIESDQFEGGKHEISMKGKATMALSKSDNDWKIRHIHTSREQQARAETESNPH